MTLLRAYLELLGSVALLTAVFYVVELLIPAEESQTLRNRFCNWLYLPVITLWAFGVQFVLAPCYAMFVRLGEGGVLSRFRDGNAGIATEIVLALAFAVLWETHQFHHSDTAQCQLAGAASRNQLHRLFRQLCPDAFDLRRVCAARGRETMLRQATISPFVTWYQALLNGFGRGARNERSAGGV